ncbi:MAG: DUF1801 domain-containing protein [Minwuia sp.]|uniref:DUF1801 domain-containing protein n=1 Tax=Minwuia sp. TaxID=2493630 RepID=UPI003A8786D8
MSRNDPPFADPAVAACFQAVPEPARSGMLALRRLIFETAAETPGVGALQETLKWGQPAYLTPETKSGSTIRIGLPKQGGYAIYAHCQTSIIPDFRSLFPDDFAFEGNRAIHFPDDVPPPAEPLRLLIRNALTYHLRRKQGAA